MNLEKMYQWRMKVTNNKLLRWYIYIGVAMILLFATSAVGCSTPPTVQDILEQEPAGYPTDVRCDPKTTLEYCKGPSPTQMECYCIARYEGMLG